MLRVTQYLFIFFAYFFWIWQNNVCRVNCEVIFVNIKFLCDQVILYIFMHVTDRFVCNIRLLLLFIVTRWFSRKDDIPNQSKLNVQGILS